MFFENANLQHPRRHHEFFLRCRPYRGEPPAVAGLLLYPDTPAKMETTSREAFCFRPFTQQGGGKGHHVGLNKQLEGHRSPLTSSRQTGKGNSSGEKEPGEDEQEGDCERAKSRAAKREPTGMQSQYQKDFPPPSSCRRRRTPALPQPDNIGINPAFGIEFSTVQRETYPGWPVTGHRLAGRMRAASPGQPNVTF